MIVDSNLHITEVISRSEQGVTRPFLCRGNNGMKYFVKGKSAGRRALICEWVAGSLGLKLGLPIPQIRLMKVPADLITYSARDDIKDLGEGIVFASEKVENVDELKYILINKIDPFLKAKILLFDWWIANIDRTLSDAGGNPNLLWAHVDQQIKVIDHNVAFDFEDLDLFSSKHIFGESHKEWTDSFKSTSEKEMKHALQFLDSIWSMIPEEWLEAIEDLNLNVIKKFLWRFDHNSAKFWSIK